ncbi:alpha/beta hydrolase [Grimontia kaedaensis]|uniref:Alpha/beta hydrolase n=1 Tax=Grimontia kaedaensis TaxID=2872157 RepID=A0ABY4WQX4_9GAMM|nr:alpha/beta hydrolase [Grimontia kaedaensis]USH01685.1 alpha/beta hydrolase [Grimontia kaedaensis]
MKKLNLFDRLNAASLLLVSPEWPKVKAAQKRAQSFENPVVNIPLETRTIAGRKIRLAEAGSVDAPTVVLLSPFPASILNFAGSWESLTTNFRVIAIDLPGFGGSEGDRHDMTPTAQGNHLAAIFDALELNDIHLVAPDVGMASALSYVLDHEHRLTSMVIGHSIGNPNPVELGFMIDMLAKFGFMRATSALLGAGPLIAYSAKIGAVRHQASAVEIDDYKSSYAGRAPEVIHWFKDFYAKSEAIAARLGEIQIPTLVFWGELDVLFKASNAERIHAALPNSKLHVLPEAGHFSWADQPKMFASMIESWVVNEHKQINTSA